MSDAFSNARDAFKSFVDETDLAGNGARVARGFWPKMRRVAARVPFAEDAVAAWFCAMDADTPLRVRGLLLAALAYFVMPFDLVPDLLIGIGFGDDLTVIVSTVTLLAANIKPSHREAARRVLNGEDEMTETGARRAAASSGITPDPASDPSRAAPDPSREAEEAEIVEPRVKGGEGL